MKHNKTILSFILILSIILSAMPAFAYGTDYFEKLSETDAKNQSAATISGITYEGIMVLKYASYGVLDESYKDIALEKGLEAEVFGEFSRLDAAKLLYNCFYDGEQFDSNQYLKKCTDIPEEYKDAVIWLYHKGITSGVSLTNYGTGKCDEQTFFIFIMRLLGFYDETKGVNSEKLAELGKNTSMVPYGVSSEFTIGDACMYIDEIISDNPSCRYDKDVFELNEDIAKRVEEAKAVLRDIFTNKTSISQSYRVPDVIYLDLCERDYENVYQALMAAMRFLPESITVRFEKSDTAEYVYNDFIEQFYDGKHIGTYYPYFIQNLDYSINNTPQFNAVASKDDVNYKTNLTSAKYSLTISGKSYKEKDPLVYKYIEQYYLCYWMNVTGFTFEDISYSEAYIVNNHTEMFRYLKNDAIVDACEQLYEDFKNFVPLYINNIKQAKTNGNCSTYLITANSAGKSTNENYQEEIASLSDKEIAEAIEKFVCSKLIYSDSSLQTIHNSSKNYDENVHSLAGIINGRVVCDGYSNIFRYLILQCDIPCVEIIGKTDQSTEDTAHSWVKIYFNNLWHNYDPCWADEDTQIISVSTYDDCTDEEYIEDGRTFLKEWTYFYTPTVTNTEE